MRMNRVQFQPGLSMPEFFERYGTEGQCQAALQAARWPRGFVCPKCGRVGCSRASRRQGFQRGTACPTGRGVRRTIPERRWFECVELDARGLASIGTLDIRICELSQFAPGFGLGFVIFRSPRLLPPGDVLGAVDRHQPSHRDVALPTGFYRQPVTSLRDRQPLAARRHI